MSNQRIKLAFLGDIGLIGNYVNKKKYNNPFKEISDFLSKTDLVIGNLECTIEVPGYVNKLKKPRLYTNDQTLNYLKNINLKLAGLANNHIFDGLEAGLESTIQKLQELDIDFFGAGLNQNQYKPYFIYECKNIKIGIINTVTPDTNPSIPENSNLLLNIYSAENLKRQINELKNKVNYIIIYIHWGGVTEGGNYPDLSQYKIGRQLIDFGADVIIGHHSHTLQPYEKYKGKYIFHSLGNFCFSDFTFENKLRPLDYKNRGISVVLTLTFDLKGYQYTFLPVRNVNQKIVIDNRIIKILQLRTYINKIIQLAPFWYIYFFYLKKIYPVWFFFTYAEGTLLQKSKKLIFKLFRK